jgi:hypothetical protein
VAIAAIDVFCRFVDDETNLYRFIVHGSIGTRHTGLSDKPLVTRLGEQLGAALAAALERAGADPSPATTWAYAILGAVFSATEHWLQHRHIPRAELVAQIADLVTPALEAAGVRPADPGDPGD